MQKDILAGLLKTVSGVVLGASEYASVVPNLVGGAIESVDDGKKAARDVGEIIRDVEGGRWGEVVSDIGPIVGDAMKILGNFGVKVPLLGEVASKMSSLPSVAGLQAAKAA